jgi:dCMP deaminase
MTDRPTWDDVWMETALAVAKRSLCERAQVGAVIVTKDNRVEAASFNGAPDRTDTRGLPCSHWCERQRTGVKGPDYSTCPSIHAEANALMRADWSKIQQGTLYVTGAVCANCAKLIMGSGLLRVVQCVNPDEGHRDPETVEDQMRKSGLVVMRYHYRLGLMTDGSS